jgi:tetratricopeptide (TPR) repeat protein
MTLRAAMRRPLAASLLAVVLALSPFAHAQPKASVPPEKMAEAKSYFEAGAKAFDAGEFETAIQAFTQAYKIVPRDNLVFSIAQAHRRQYVATGDEAHAKASIDFYRRYLAAVPAGGRRAEAVKALEDLESRVKSAPEPGKGVDLPAAPVADKTRIFINSRTPGAVFTVDGGEEIPVARSVEVKAGAHKIRVSAPGHLAEDVTVEAREGELVPQSVDLRAQPAHLRIRADSGSSVYVDGRFVGEAPLPDALQLAPGRHYVSLSLRGHESDAAEVVVAAGDRKDLLADLPTTNQRDVAYGFIVTGAAFAAASTVFFAVSAVRHGEARQIYSRYLTDGITPAEVAEYDNILQQRDRFALGGGVTGVLSIAVGLVGAGLYVFDDVAPLSVPREIDEKGDGPPGAGPTFDLSAIPLIGPHGGGASFAGSF